MTEQEQEDAISYACGDVAKYGAAAPLHSRFIMHLIQQIGQMRAEREWIPVSERLPNTGQKVLAHNRWHRESVAVDEYGEWWDPWGRKLVTPQFWQPLPKPPTTEGEQK